MSDSVILNRIVDTYDTIVTEKGIEDIKIKSNVLLKTVILKSDVTACLEICNKYGKKYKRRCMLKTNSIGEIVVNTSFIDAINLFFKHSNIKGYERNARK